jgi:hypothetical protein
MLAAMSPRSLRHRLLSPLGRFAVGFLAVAMFCSGLKIGQIHRHAGGDHDHGHAAGEYWCLVDHDPHSLAAAAQHRHEVGSLASILPTAPPVIHANDLPATLHVPWDVEAPAPVDDPPLLRPPIS